ncbi:MAG: type VI secretion system-associated protein TagF [Azoarcus sp.]|jgi:type VI secretion system protein ImpM|nr:type VI secretion system-associated protein TagF [Azoarcus sp.]
MIAVFSPPSPSHYMGWFGKLPAVGDFAGKGIPQSMKETVHTWMSSGMAALVRTWPEEWRDAYFVSPVWHFVVNANIWDKFALTGCIAPSIDRVGRCSPLIVLRSFDKAEVRRVLPPESRWLYRVDAAIRRIIGECVPVDGVDSILAQLMARESAPDADTGILDGLGIDEPAAPPRKAWFSWPDLPALFGERTTRSFWWAEPSPRLPPRQLIHRGIPDEDLFRLLMDGGMPHD